MNKIIEIAKNNIVDVNLSDHKTVVHLAQLVTNKQSVDDIVTILSTDSAKLSAFCNMVSMIHIKDAQYHERLFMKRAVLMCSMTCLVICVVMLCIYHASLSKDTIGTISTLAGIFIAFLKDIYQSAINKE